MGTGLLAQMGMGFCNVIVFTTEILYSQTRLLKGVNVKKMQWLFSTDRNKPDQTNTEKLN
jgi:hypothetical protein